MDKIRKSPAHIGGLVLQYIDRLESISKMKEATREIMGTLTNILKNQKYGFHFFTRLAQPKWIIQLKHAENDRKFFEKFDLISAANRNWNLHGTYLTDQLR